MTSLTSTRGKLRWPQMAGLSIAALLSFAIAAYWSITSRQDADDLVMPVERPRPPIAVATAPVSTVMESLQPTGELMLHMTANSARVNSQVVRNPFGDLNLLASAELAASRNIVATVNTVAKIRKPIAPLAAIAPIPLAPPAVAPALPFAVVGGISGQRIAEGQPVVFLRVRDDVLVVRPGDEIDKTYRVDSITTEKIEFTYLPLQQRQVLMMKP